MPVRSALRILAVLVLALSLILLVASCFVAAISMSRALNEASVPLLTASLAALAWLRPNRVG